MDRTHCLRHSVCPAGYVEELDMEIDAAEKPKQVHPAVSVPQKKQGTEHAFDRPTTNIPIVLEQPTYVLPPVLQRPRQNQPQVSRLPQQQTQQRLAQREEDIIMKDIMKLHKQPKIWTN